MIKCCSSYHKILCSLVLSLFVRRHSSSVTPKWYRDQRSKEGQKEMRPASNKQANRVRRSAELSGLIFCISNGKAAMSPSAAVTGYQSQARPRQPGRKHSLHCAHQRGSSPLTQSMMGFRRKKRKSHFPSTLVNPSAPSGQTHKHQHVSVGCVSERELRQYWIHVAPPHNPATRPHVAKQLSALFSLRVWLPEGSGEPRPRPQSLTVLVGKCFLPYSRLSLLTRPPLIIAAALAERPQDSSASKWDKTNKAICVWTAAKTQVCCSEKALLCCV